MNPKKSVKIALAIMLCIILVIPIIQQYSLPYYWSEESPIIQETQNIQEPKLMMDDKGCFIENKGQVGNDDIMFYSSIPGGTIGFAESKVLLWSYDEGNVVELSFPGGNLVSPEGITQTEAYFNYFLGDRGTFTHVRGFESVVFEEIWSGIDLVYRTTSQGAKYEFRAAPGANPSDIRVRCEGQDDLIVDEIDITIVMEENAYRDVGLLVWQENGRTVQASYLRHDQQTYGVDIGEYDQSERLIVDPLIFSTYIGGSSSDSGYSTIVDGQDNIIVAGWTDSSDFPVVSAYNDTHGGGQDCFVTKLDSDGDLLFSTYIGGSDHDSAYAVEVDAAGQIYVVGRTQSPDFPTTTGAYDETHNGGYDVAVFRLTATGDSLVFSTFVGGSGQDIAYGLDTMPAPVGGSYLYVTGFTESADFPIVQCVTPGWNSTYTAGRDSFVFRMEPDGSYLLWSNIVGGSGDDTGYDVGVDTTYNVMVTGWTDSGDLNTTDSAYDESYNGDTDCFCLAFSPDGDELSYLTYIGGSAYDKVMSLAVGRYGDSYVTGYTTSTDFPTTLNAYDRSYNQGGDSFAFRLSVWGTGLEFSTYIGGFGDDTGRMILLDSSDNIIVVGLTLSTDFPTLHAYDSSSNGLVDGYILKLNFNGETLISSTYFGGAGDDWIRNGVALDTNGNIVIVGKTDSTDFPIVGNQVYDSTHNGGFDAFVMVFSADFSYPEFNSVTRSPQSPNSLEDVQITANATDPEGVTQVTLQYRTDTSWENVTMTRVSTGGTSWHGTIPAQVSNTTVEYRVVASDAAGNSVESALDDYLVVVPPPIEIPLGLIIAIVSLIAAVLGIVGGLIKMRAIRLERRLKGDKKKDSSKSEVDSKST